jgi:hypothetical protein
VGEGECVHDRAVLDREDGQLLDQPSVELGAIAVWSQPWFGLAGRALDVPKQQSTTVAKGQQRSLTEVADLRRRRIASSPTVLPKLAVAQASWSALGPHATVRSGPFLTVRCGTRVARPARTTSAQRGSAGASA